MKALIKVFSNEGERLPVRPVLPLCVRAKMGELIHLSAILTYASARCGWDSSAETIGRVSRGASKTRAKGHCVSAAIIRKRLS